MHISILRLLVGAPLKVSISGTFSAGKTTLCRALSAAFPRAALIEELATSAKQLIPSLDWRQFDARAYLFWAQALVEARSVSNAQMTLFDGSIIDVFAHTRAFQLDVPDRWRRISLLHPYDLTLVCDPKGIAVEDNQIRETDPNLRAVVQALVLSEAPKLSRKIVLLEGCDDQRLAKAISAIEDALDLPARTGPSK